MKLKKLLLPILALGLMVGIGTGISYQSIQPVYAAEEGEVTETFDEKTYTYDAGELGKCTITLKSPVELVVTLFTKDGEQSMSCSYVLVENILTVNAGGKEIRLLLNNTLMTFSEYIDEYQQFYEETKNNSWKDIVIDICCFVGAAIVVILITILWNKAKQGKLDRVIDFSRNAEKNWDNSTKLVSDLESKYNLTLPKLDQFIETGNKQIIELKEENNLLKQKAEQAEAQKIEERKMLLSII